MREAASSLTRSVHVSWARGLAPAVLAITLAGVLCVACGGKSSDVTATPRPRPSPVAFATQTAPQFTLADPSFDALPGATAHFGTLGGSAYKVEIPEKWNGKLVLFLHGTPGSYRPQLYVEDPPIRHELIREGYAWGASSFSTLGYPFNLGADETAALWDKFVDDYGHPSRTYLIGASGGGGASIAAAERYANRFDGVLSLCPAAGLARVISYYGETAAAAALASGIEFNVGVAQFMDSRQFVSVLGDPASHDHFSDIWARLTGGRRPFDAQGLALNEDYLIASGLRVIASGELDNATKAYAPGLDWMSDDEFNSRFFRAHRTSALPPAVDELTGAIQMPVLALYATGDSLVPISLGQYERNIIDGAGQSKLLVQRAIRAPEHCGFTTGEEEQAFRDLVAWVAQRKRPQGEDLLAHDLGDLGTFTQKPRLGSPEADGLPGASSRLSMRGSITIDGKSHDTIPFLRVIDEHDGLVSDCRLTFEAANGGKYERILASGSDVHGCGVAGSKLYLETLSNNRKVFSAESVSWPEGSSDVAMNVDFSTSDRRGTSKPFTAVVGDILDKSGHRLPPGTVVDAYIGDTLCGTSSIPPTATPADGYDILVSGPELKTGCERGGSITFRVNGIKVSQTATNSLDPDADAQWVDLYTK